MDILKSDKVEKVKEGIHNFVTRQNLGKIHLIFIVMVILLIYSVFSTEYSNLLRTFIILGILIAGFMDSYVIFFDLDNEKSNESTDKN